MFFFPEHGLGCVVLTNKRGANGFLASVRQKFLELTFGLPEKSKAIRESFKGIDAQFTKILWSKVSFAPQDLAPLTTLAGTYTNEYLGKMEICQDVQGAFKARTNDWILSIGVETKEDQSRFLVLKESPSDGTFRFLVQQEGSLLLDGGQTKYIFVRTP
jgi:hypothetical protein